MSTMAIPSGLMSAIQQLLPKSQSQAPPRPPGYDGEMPEFDVRTGQPFGKSGSLIPDSNAQPPDDSPVSGDKENAVLSDMRSGRMPGTGLSQSDTKSTLSSAPSGTPTTPPSGHGDDNDILTRLPKIQMPDINTFPGTAHINQLKSDLDKARTTTPVHGWRRIAQIGAELAPVGIGAAVGGWRGAGAGAEGTVQAEATMHQRSQDQQNELLRQIQEETSSRDSQYAAAGHTNLANATMQSNALLRDAMMKNQAGIAQGHDTTKVTTTNTQADSRESVASANREAKQKLVDAQAGLAQARKSMIPTQIKIWEDRVRIAQQAADASTTRANSTADNTEANLFGTVGGKPLAGAPTSPSGQPIGFKPYAATGPTGTTKTKMDQVDAITSVGKTLLSEIDKNANSLGPFTGRWKNLEEMWGNLPPEAARVAGLQESFASLQPALHQFRSTTAKRDFERRLQIGSFKTNAEAMKAGVQAAMDSAKEMKDAWAAGRGGAVEPGPGTAKPSPRGIQSQPPATAQPQAEEWERDPATGKLRRKQ